VSHSSAAALHSPYNCITSNKPRAKWGRGGGTSRLWAWLVHLRQVLHDKRADAGYVHQRQQEQQQLGELVPDQLAVEVLKVQGPGHAGALVHQPGLQHPLRQVPAERIPFQQVSDLAKLGYTHPPGTLT